MSVIVLVTMMVAPTYRFELDCEEDEDLLVDDS